MPFPRNHIITDCETTGISPKQGHEIIQISATALNHWDLSDHHAGEFDVYIKPERPELASPEALAIVGPIFDKAMEEGVSLKTALKKFMKWIDKVDPKGKYWSNPWMWAHNAGFEEKFYKHYLIEEKLVEKDEFEEYTFPWAFNRMYDTMQTTYEIFDGHPQFDNYKLDTAIKALGIKTEDRETFHNAMEDVRITKEYLTRCLLYLRKCQTRMNIS